jgi:hypothetical protein
MRGHRLCLATTAAALLLFGSGCSRMIKVRGTLLFNGQPVEGATILFENPDGGRPAVGHTDKEGIFQLTTFKQQDGAMAGTYKVAITPPMKVPEVKGYKGMGLEGALAQYAESKKHLKEKPAPFGADIPDVYRTVKSTPLTQKVPPDGPVVFDIAGPTAEAPKTQPKPRPQRTNKGGYRP